MIKSRINCITSNSSFEYVDQDQVFQEIKKLDGNKASSKNDIPIKRMKKNIDIITYILYRNFTNSLFDSEFPSKLKEADITPDYEKEEKCLIGKYRLVNILPNVSKVYKRLMYDQINAFFETILSNIQCGFQKGDSAQHCLIALTEKYCKFLNRGDLSGSLMTEFSKAFDCIDHKLLTAKMLAYRFHIKSLKLAASLEENRR